MGDFIVELNRPFNFANIQGYPYDIPKKTIDKLPTFQGNNDMLAIDYWKKFRKVIKKICSKS
jgi:hypothetical protein